MGVDLVVNLAGLDPAIKFLEELGDAPESGELWEVIGRAEMNLVRDHLCEKNAKGNSLGGSNVPGMNDLG